MFLGFDANISKCNHHLIFSFRIAQKRYKWCYDQGIFTAYTVL